MTRNLGYLAAGVAVGLVVTGLIVNKEIRDQKEREEVIEDGLFERRSNRGRPFCGSAGKYCTALQGGGRPLLRIPHDPGVRKPGEGCRVGHERDECKAAVHAVSGNG